MSENPIPSLYDAAAQEYERTRVPRFRPFVKKLLQRYDTRPRSWVLDAGCGTGLAATMVAPRVGHAGKVIGIDASAGMLELARNKARGYGFDQCEFRLGDIHALDLEDALFDVVICSFALWGDFEDLFRGFYRVLKPGGVLLAQNWMVARDPALAAYDARLAARRVEPGDARLNVIREALAAQGAEMQEFETPEAYERELRAAGFSDARGYQESISTRFADPDALIGYQSAGVRHRAEIEAMTDAERAEFEGDVRRALEPFTTAQGLQVEMSAIQVVSRK